MPLQEVHTGFTFGFDGSKFAAIQRGVSRASTNLNTIAAKTEIFTQNMGGFFARAKQVIGVYLGFRAVRLITTDYADAADATAKFASGLGISAQQYQRVAFAADLSGISINELNMALPKLAKSAGDAADGSKSMAIAFRRAGVDIKDTEGKLKDPITLLTEMADGMKNIEDKGRRTQILMNIFGRAGKKMGVLLDEGSAGIKKMMAEADKLGIVLSQKDLKAAERFKDEMLRLKSVLLGVRNIIAAKVVPTLSNAIEKFRKWWVEGKNAERALRSLKLVAIFTGIVIARLIGASALKQIKLFVQGIWAGVQALRAMGVAAGVTAIKVWAIVAAFALVALAIEDLIGFAQGKDSVIGRILGDTKLAKELKKALLDMGKEFKKAWKDMAPALAAAWIQIRRAVADLWKEIRPLIGPAFRFAIDALIIALEVITTLVSGITNAVKWMSQAWDDANAAVNRWTIAAEDAANAAGKAIKDAWNDANDAVNKVLVGIEDAGKAAAKAVGGAWDSALGGLKSALDAITSAAITAYRAVAAALGLSDVGGALNLDVAKAAATAAASKLSAGAGRAPAAGGGGPALLGPRLPFGGLTGGPIRSFAPAPGFHLPPGFQAPPDITTTVASGAIQVTVQGATGSPAAIAAAINAALPPAISKVFTDASRDMVKPPRGQR